MEVLGILVIIAMIVGGGFGVVKAKEPKTKIACLAFLVMGIWICYLAINSPSSSEEYDNEGSGYSPSFKRSEASKYNGKKCGVWMSTDWCDCYGCASSNRDPFICSRCGHRCDEHTR